jgi:putative transposase
MQLVEQTIIGQQDPRFTEIDAAAFAAKNLYNAANYLVRQSFIFQKTYLPSAEVFHQIKTHEAYRALPAKVSNSILIQLHKNWVCFFESLEEWKQHPDKFTGRPKLPRYKDKGTGRFLLIYDTQALGKRIFKKTGMLVPSGLQVMIPTRITEWSKIAQLRIVPKSGFYVVETVYSREESVASVDPKLVMAIDLGVNVLAAITSNKEDFHPRIVSGKPIKSLNQGYNKLRAKHQSRLAKGSKPKHTSRALDLLTTKRNRRIKQYLHTASRRILNECLEEGIGTIVVGKNPLWKQEVEMGKRNNQQFVQIPHAQFISMLEYKGKLVGIQVKTQEESYTSKASFLDLDPLPTYSAKSRQTPTFSGKRLSRSWYQAKDATLIHADINGSYNILRKSSSDPLQLGRGVVGAKAVLPRRLAV